MKDIKNEIYTDFENKQIKRNESIKKYTTSRELNYSILKVVEEASELNEVLVKMLTKQNEHKPPISKVIEELGDLMLRLDILQEHMNIKKEVNKRIDDKLTLILK